MPTKGPFDHAGRRSALKYLIRGFEPHPRHHGECVPDVPAQPVDGVVVDGLRGTGYLVPALAILSDDQPVPILG